MNYYGLTKEEYINYIKRRKKSLESRKSKFLAEGGKGNKKLKAHSKALEALEQEIKKAFKCT